MQIKSKKTPESMQDAYANKYWEKRKKENQKFNNVLESRGVNYARY